MEPRTSTKILSRDVRLSAEEIVTLRDITRRRRRELERRLERTSYADRPNMKESVLNELSMVRELERTFAHNHEQLARQFAEHVLGVSA